MAWPTSSRSSSRVKTSPLEASVLATMPTALRLTSAHPDSGATMQARTVRRVRVARVRENVGMLN